MAFNLNGFNSNESILDAQSKVIPTWAEVINRAILGMNVNTLLYIPTFQDHYFLASGFDQPAFSYNDRKPLCYAVLQIDRFATCCSANYGDLYLRQNALNSILYP
jgi:hypothetical protein